MAAASPILYLAFKFIEFILLFLCLSDFTFFFKTIFFCTSVLNDRLNFVLFLCEFELATFEVFRHACCTF